MLFSRRSSRPRGLAALLPGRALLAALLLALLAPLAQAEDGKRLRIGITLHPYYSYVSNIVGDKAEVVPLIPAGFNPHAYEPRAEDIKRIGTLDVVVLNGVGHDDFAERMIASSEKPGIPVIEANAKVPLLAATGMAARGAGKVVNPHTFLSISASITQVNTIARELGKLDPANAKAYTRNARAYAKRLRALRADALARLNKAPAADFRVATIHGAYDYLLREGVRIHEYCQRPLHGKVAVIDDDWSTIGSSNLDPLSLSLNLEANLVIRDVAFNGQLYQHLRELARRHCRRISRRHARRGYWWRAPLIFLGFHFSRHFPAIAGWVPAHLPRLKSLEPRPSRRWQERQGQRGNP